MHRREVAERVGGWKHYRTVWRNPECEFEYQAYLAGFRFISTRELTVFKFNSALRKNSYVEKPCFEQEAYLRKIQRSRWFLLKETLEIAWVHLRQLPMNTPAIPAPPTEHTPGWHVTHYRKFRGLE